MCKNATQTAASLMQAIEPTLVSLLTATGIASTPDGVAAINAFNAAEKALASWQPGTTSATVIEVIDAFTSVFATLPIPDDAKELEQLISAGIVTVIGVIMANSPASVPASAIGAEEAPASFEETQAMHQAAVIHDTTVKVQTMVPSFKRAIFTSPAHQYRNAWNKAVEADPKYAALKQ